MGDATVVCTVCIIHISFVHCVTYGGARFLDLRDFVQKPKFRFFTCILFSEFVRVCGRILML